jgi:hypothetical protein
MGEFFDKIQIFPDVDIALHVENGSLSPGLLWQLRQWDNFVNQNIKHVTSPRSRMNATLALKFGSMHVCGSQVKSLWFMYYLIQCAQDLKSSVFIVAKIYMRVMFSIKFIFS